jgi:hypothetical protein
MKVKFTLETKESLSLYQVLEDIPTDLCCFVNCPDMEGNACENCPMAAINQKWQNMHERIQEEILPMIKEIER